MMRPILCRCAFRHLVSPVHDARDAHFWLPAATMLHPASHQDSLGGVSPREACAANKVT